MSELVDDYDSPWKEALEHFFEDFMAFFFPVAHAGIDWRRGYQFLDKELQQVARDAELGRRYADILAQVWRQNGQETWVLVHVEVQGQQQVEWRAHVRLQLPAVRPLPAAGGQSGRAGRRTGGVAAQ